MSPAMAALVGLGALGLALGLMAYLLVAPSHRLPLERRRPGVVAGPSIVERAAGAATGAVGGVLRRRGGSSAAGVLEQAGVRMRVQDFVFLVAVATLAAAALGLLLGGALPAVLLAVAVPVVARVVLSSRRGRRQAAFADQLEDAMQLMAASMRAGYSVLQALDSVAHEAEEPMSQELSRVVNETRMGRDLGVALEQTARRMNSQDFVWVSQAIAINREVGGNLADVLDGVSATIRERNQLRGQVRALAAEGKLSAVVLICLPFGIIGFLMVINPGYLAPFTENVLGWILLAVAAFLLVVGSIWLRKTVSIKF